MFVYIHAHSVFQCSRLLSEGPRLSDIAQPPVVQSYSHTVQHGMTTSQAHAVNQVPTQTGMETQQFYHNGIGTVPQQNGMQSLPSTVQLPHGMGMQMQHGVMPQQPQSGIGTQPPLSTGLGMQQNGMVITQQNGTGTQNLSSVYSSSPGRYVSHEVCVRECCVQCTIHTRVVEFTPTL